jgi:hypothetical protein
MPQNDYGNPTSPFTGTQLNNRLRDWRDALHSLHRGTSRPTYAVAGMLWLQEISSTEWRLQLYDGDTDILLGTINPTANTFTPAGVTGFAPLTGATFTGAVVVPNATADGHALNRVTADARYAQLTGATFSGSVVVPNATADGHALNRVTADGRYALLTGATFTGAVTLPASNPTNANHAARKAYVDSQVANVSGQLSNYAPKPQSPSGVGQVEAISGSSYTLPSGGTWFAFRFVWRPKFVIISGENETTVEASIYSPSVLIAAGGTAFGSPPPGFPSGGSPVWVGFAWRIA